MFTIHAIQAAFGDSLLLEYGEQNAPLYMLIDGGPPRNYENALSDALDDLVTTRELERVVLSHVDNDHVVGLLDFFGEIQQQVTNGQQPGFKIGGLWHNSFAASIDPNNTIAPRIQGLLTAAGARAQEMTLASIAVNGIPEGNRLRTFALQLGIPLNDNLGLITTATDSSGLNLGIDVTFVAPSQANLDELKAEWEAWLERMESAAGNGLINTLANSDRSIPNLSSIVMLVEADGRTALLTGDARSDHIVKGLDARGLLQNGKAHFDLIKLPHHGSDRNITKTFFKNITADKYLVSADGTHDNPDVETLVWLVEAAKEAGRPVEIIATNETESTEELLTTHKPATFGYTIRFIDGGNSVAVPLA